MKQYTTLQPDKRDYWIAGGLVLISLAVYIRTLAPDILYGDSAEFQTLAYTLGYTHSTGYPIYLLLARLVGLIPIENLAWRVNLLSAISAAVTAGGVYLLAKYFTRNRLGSILGSLLLIISHTFWFHAIIAEIYTPAMAFITVILNLLLSWQEAPEKRNRALVIAAFLSAVGLGVHASVGLLAPASVLLVVWVWIKLRQNHAWLQKSILSAVLSTLCGSLVLLGSFLYIDWHNPVSSFHNVMLEPSRSLWSLTEQDIDSPFERIYYTFTGLQWRDAMFPDDLDPGVEVYDYVERVSTDEFHWLFILFALIGLGWAVYRMLLKGIFLAFFLICSTYYVLHYNPFDQYIFYLPTYIVYASAGGIGISVLLDWLGHQLQRIAIMRILTQVLTISLMAYITSAPFLDSRWNALQTRTASFIKDDYVYPMRALKEPRAAANIFVHGLPENAVLIMDWRALYTTYYIAHVEQQKPDIRIMEAIPHGSDGNLAESMVEELNQAIKNGYPVYSQFLYGDIEKHFKVERSSINGYYRLSLK